MLRSARWTLVLLVLTPHMAGLLWANGGGYSFGVKFTGNVAPFQPSGTESIRILREDLTIRLRRTDAAVDVRYSMRNLGAAAVRAKFGFPVEAIYTDDLPDETSEDATAQATSPGETRRTGAQAIQQLKGYQVTVDGTAVRSEYVVEPFASGRIRAFRGSEALKGIGGWMVSDVTFAPSQTLAVEIHYTADHRGDTTFVSDDADATPLSFHYRLSTGAVWNGPIESGTITIQAVGIPAVEAEIVRPRERFRRMTDRWVWEFRDLEPTLADDITVNAVPAYFETYRGDYTTSEAGRESAGQYYLRRHGKWAEGHQRFKATASSVLAPNAGHTYGAEGIARLLPASPWCEGVPGAGTDEYVEVVPRAPKRLMALGLYSGFQDYRRPGLFKRNARPASVEIRLNDEAAFSASLGDRDHEQLIPIVDYAQPVSKLRITIKEVYPGTSFEDTCISRLVLYDLLPRDPVVPRAR